MVTPAAKREAVAHLKGAHEMSERRACRVLGGVRMAVRYRSRRRDDPKLRERLVALTRKRRRFGYRRLLIFRRREGFVVNHKRLFRLYREEWLMVRKRRGPKASFGQQDTDACACDAERSMGTRLRVGSARGCRARTSAVSSLSRINFEIASNRAGVIAALECACAAMRSRAVLATSRSYLSVWIRCLRSPSSSTMPSQAHAGIDGPHEQHHIGSGGKVTNVCRQVGRRHCPWGGAEQQPYVLMGPDILFRQIAQPAVIGRRSQANRGKPLQPVRCMRG